jgi:hypothetical protein
MLAQHGSSLAEMRAWWLADASRGMLGVLQSWKLHDSDCSLQLREKQVAESYKELLY